MGRARGLNRRIGMQSGGPRRRSPESRPVCEWTRGDCQRSDGVSGESVAERDREEDDPEVNSFSGMRQASLPGSTCVCMRCEPHALGNSRCSIMSSRWSGRVEHPARPVWLPSADGRDGARFPKVRQSQFSAVLSERSASHRARLGGSGSPPRHEGTKERQDSLKGPTGRMRSGGRPASEFAAANFSDER